MSPETAAVLLLGLTALAGIGLVALGGWLRAEWTAPRGRWRGGTRDLL
jgi:hypothetical protein